MMELKIPDRVPPTMAMWRFSAAQEVGSEGVVEGVVVMGSWVGDEVGADVEDEEVDVDVVVEVLVAVEEFNINVPRDLVVIFRTEALLQQLFLSSAARQQ